MAVPATVFEIVNLGVESTKGTPVAANKRVTGAQFSPQLQVDVKRYRPSGYRYNTVASLNKEWSQFSLSGPLLYTEIVYWLSSALKAVTPTGAGAAKTWLFSHASDAPETIKTYTMEFGSAVHAMKVAYAFMSGFGFAMSHEECTFNGTSMGKAISDDIALTSSPTELPLEPVTGSQVQFYVADTQAGLDAAQALNLGLMMEFSVDGIFGPVWAATGDASWREEVALVPNTTASLLVGFDDEGMAPLAKMRAGSTQWLRAKAIGPVIEATDTYLFQVDFAAKVLQPREMRDENGVFAVRWELEPTHDSTWGKAYEIKVVNTLSSL